MGWAVGALGRWAGIAPQEWPARLADEANWLLRYGQLLSPAWALDGKGDQLCSIFSLLGEGEKKGERSFTVAAKPLSAAALPADEEVPSQELWQGFTLDYKRLPHDERRFDTFTHVLCKHAWAVPCTYGEKGVSLYEEFKALAALVYACRGVREPAGSCLLVGGDIPGIQGFLYTLTSKGAAKGLRGRSFYLQLLGDAVVRALRRELGGLPEANVIYAAGGNFLLLAPAQSENVLQRWHKDFNRRLLEEYGGDLYLALAWEELPLADVGGAAFSAGRDRLGARVAAAKGRHFAELAEEWDLLFQPEGSGGEEYCQVCQREPQPGEELKTILTESGERVKKCQQCLGFEQLAYDILPDPAGPLLMIVTDQPQSVEGWRASLSRLTGFDYCFSDTPPRTKEQGMVYLLNDTDLGGKGAHGFRFIANVTPRIERADRVWMAEHYPEVDVPPGERIKDFGMMALQAEGIARVGVLRMDVDNLGAIFSRYLRGSMPQVAALSAALDRFFVGHLHRICKRVEAAGKHSNVLYVIYAGGDDLFVVGSWDRMPVLAEQIQEDFGAYTGQRLTLSGGLTLEGRGFPLYRAAERAGEAEEKAKRFNRPGRYTKSAFCFLGQVVGWEEWTLVEEIRRKLFCLDGAGVPRSLFRILQIIHACFVETRQQAIRANREAGREPAPDRLYWGRWAWMAAYSLSRLAQGCSEKEKGEILELQREWIESGKRIHFLGLAARWAEYQLRR